MSIDNDLDRNKEAFFQPPREAPTNAPIMQISESIFSILQHCMSQAFQATTNENVLSLVEQHVPSSLNMIMMYWKNPKNVYDCLVNFPWGSRYNKEPDFKKIVYFIMHKLQQDIYTQKEFLAKFIQDPQIKKAFLENDVEIKFME